MARRSSIEQLPQEVQDHVHRLIREGRTVDEITGKLHELDQDVSRSSVGRYKQRYETQLQKYREAQNVAGIWVQELGQDTSSDVGRLLAEMLKTIAFKTMAEMGEDEADQPSAMDLHFLARTIKDLESAGKLSAERIYKIREEERKRVQQETQGKLEEAGKKAGLTTDTLETLKTDVFGVGNA